MLHAEREKLGYFSASFFSSPSLVSIPRSSLEDFAAIILFHRKSGFLPSFRLSLLALPFFDPISFYLFFRAHTRKNLHLPHSRTQSKESFRQVFPLLLSLSGLNDYLIMPKKKERENFGMKRRKEASYLPSSFVQLDYQEGNERQKRHLSPSRLFSSSFCMLQFELCVTTTFLLVLAAFFHFCPWHKGSLYGIVWYTKGKSCCSLLWSWVKKTEKDLYLLTVCRRPSSYSQFTAQPFFSLLQRLKSNTAAKEASEKERKEEVMCTAFLLLSCWQFLPGRF